MIPRKKLDSGSEISSTCSFNILGYSSSSPRDLNSFKEVIRYSVTICLSLQAAILSLPLVLHICLGGGSKTVFVEISSWSRNWALLPISKPTNRRVDIAFGFPSLPPKNIIVSVFLDFYCKHIKHIQLKCLSWKNICIHFSQSGKCIKCVH